MKKKSISCLAISMVVTLTACGGQNESSTGNATVIEAATAAEEAAAEENIPIQLNYAQGISDGIYGWTLSEDGSYYMLSAIDGDGTPVESSVEQNFMHGGRNGGAAGDNTAGGGNGEKRQKQGDLSDDGNEGKTEDSLAMEANEQVSAQRVNAQGVYTESNITNTEYQTMLIFVPAEYLTINADGSAAFTNAEVNGYTAQTAPIVFQNSNGGWRSGSPKAPEYADCLAAGMVYVSCGSRSRDAAEENGDSTGKAPTPVADLKAGVIALRANEDVIPGDMKRIISVGASGGGQMSSALGATGNMEEYYPYLYEAGAIGVSYDETTNTYSSEYDDSVYGAMAYCPIADIENADLAYAWLRYDSTLNEDGSLSSTAGNYDFTEFQLTLQKDAAYAFAEYINSLGLTDSKGTLLTFDENADGTLNLRAGSYYDMILQNMSDALNVYLIDMENPDAFIREKYGKDTSTWLTQNEDGTYQITNLADFINGTGLVRNKDIPGFDTLDLSAENDAFGTSSTKAVHYSASIAELLQNNYDNYAILDGFNPEQFDLYIQNALTGNEAAYIAEQTYLVNATQILLDNSKGTQDSDAAQHWRTRNGMADQHTSFSVAYNICLTAEMAGYEVDYSLVWDMGHGSNEGTTTGTFVEWIQRICPKS
ncbi:MAG: hypothetical protein ACRDBO_02765 [Lachnospiraceae bacterium]